MLELSAEKTHVIKFTRFETENSKSFTFLGFEFRWGKSRKGKPLVKMRTAKKKFQLALSAMTVWIKKGRTVDWFHVVQIFTRAVTKSVSWRPRRSGRPRQRAGLS